MLDNALFNKYKELFYSLSGIALKDYKQYLVEFRLQKYIGEGKRFSGYTELYKALEAGQDKNLVRDFIDTLTTNYTFFFREMEHFNFLAEYIRKNSRSQDYIRLWSAACSSGEEAYSMGITVLENINEAFNDIKILATDISDRMLRAAINAEYPLDKVVRSVNPDSVNKYFIKDKRANTASPGSDLRDLVRINKLNLMDIYPFKKKFDIVFLRNVLIYFENSEKEEIINKVHEYIKPGGYLITGLAESLIGINHRLKPVKFSIYRKEA